MKFNRLITTLAILIVLLVANYLASRHPIRLDLTRDGIYTLSPATRDILAGLDDVLTVRVYFSQDLPPGLQPIRRAVDDLLDEYKSFAGKKFQVEHVDPASSAMEEQKAAMMGIPPLQVNVIQRDRQEVAKIYLGLAVLYGGGQEVIPVVQRAGNLEYLLDEAILRVSAESLPRIGWWQPKVERPEEGSGYSFMRQALSRRYEIEDISPANLAELDPESLKALLLISPRRMGREAIEAIDGYIAGGGKVAALIDRFSVVDGLVLKPIKTEVTRLLTKHGVTVEDSLVLDDVNATAAFTGGVVTYHISYPYWPDVRRTGFNQKLPLSSDLESAVMPWTSPLMIAGDAKPAGTDAVVAMTSTHATAIPGGEARLDPKLANEALAEGDHSLLVLAAFLDERLFVAGSSHWATDRFISMFPQNAALFQNAVDYLSMGDSLIDMRSRENMNRPIVPMPDAARLWFKYLNVATGPIAVGVIGLAFFLWRRAWRRRAVRRYS